MTKDTQPKSNKKEIITRSAKAREDKKRNIKKHIDSDNDNGSSESDNDDMNTHEYRKFLSKIFPSKHLNNKIKAGEKLKKTLENESENTCNEKIKKKSGKKKDEESEDYSDSSSEEEKKAKTPKKQSKKKKVEVESETEDEISIGSEDSSEDDSEDEAKNEETLIGKKNKKFNIVFTIGGTEHDDENEWETDDDSDYEESEDSEDTEDEDASVSSDEDADEKVEKEKKGQHKKGKNKKEISDSTPVELPEGVNVEKGNEELLSQLKELLNKNKENKSHRQTFVVNVHTKSLCYSIKLSNIFIKIC